MAVFYHASPASLAPGDFLVPGDRGYVCLATSPEQALYWGWELYTKWSGKSGRDGFSLSDCFIYCVYIPDNQIVEDCRGHYTFERPGVRKRAKEVVPHREDLDGEVVVRRKVRVMNGFVPQDWQEWGEEYRARALASL